MADKKLTITVEARNKLRAGLGAANKDLDNFQKKTKGIGAALATVKLAAVIAVVALLTRGIKALFGPYMKQELAEKQLATAIDLHGESVSKIMPIMRAYASELQTQTGVSDDVTLARMASLKMLGIETNKLADAVKAVSALTRAGVSAEAAERAIALAYEGNFEMLNRYIPALRGVRDETEKARIVNEFLTKQFEAQKEDINTISGQWKTLKNAVGDAMEGIGEAIVRTELIQGVLQGTTMTVETLSRWFGKLTGKTQEAAEALKQAARDAADAQILIAGQSVTAAKEKLAENAIKLEEERQKLLEKGWRDEAAGLKQMIALNEQKAKATIAAWQAEKKAAKEAEKIEADEQKRFDRLTRKAGRLGRFGRVSRKDQEFLEAFEARQLMRGGQQGAAVALQGAEVRLAFAELAKLNKPLNDLLAEEQRMNQHLDALLRMG
jgi:hypothetical protein